MTDIIKFETEQEWLELRTKDITSTDVAALFGLSPYKTDFELYHEKSSGDRPAFTVNERMKWGTRFESVIAHGVAEDNGWEILPLKVYMRDPILRIGSSFDFEIVHPEHGRGIMEIKNVDSLVYRNKWKDDGDGNIEAPEHIELQVQHQMMVSGYSWCAIVAMVGGNSPKIAFRRFDADVGVAIARKVAAFWKRIEDKSPPSADYSRDADLIKQLYSQVNEGEVLDVSDDEAFTTLMVQYLRAKDTADEQTKLADQFKAQLLERAGTAEKVVGTFGTLKLGRTKTTAPTVITAEMIGQTYGGRAGYRQFLFTPKKG